MSQSGIKLGLVLIATLLSATLTAGQTIMRHGGSGEGDVDIMLINELGVVVGMNEASGNLTVMVLLPDADPDMEIARDDLLLMINGQRVKDMAALRAAYEAAAVGEEVKLGFRRGDTRFLSSFEKEDAAAQAGVKRMVMIGGPGGEGEFDDMQPLTEFGVVLAEKEGQVVVAMQLPLDEVTLMKDDVIKSVNGTTVSSLEDFRSVYGELAIGAAMNIVAMRETQEVPVSGTKSDSPGRIQVRKGP